MPSMKSQLARGAIGGVVATASAVAAMLVGFSWTVFISGSIIGSLVVAGLGLAAAGVTVFTGDVSAFRAAVSTLGAHLVAIVVALPIGAIANPITGSVLPGTFTYVVVGVVLAALLCGGRLSIVVAGLAVAIVLASTAVPVQGGDSAWAMWLGLVLGAWTTIPIAARHAAGQRIESRS